MKKLFFVISLITLSSILCAAAIYNNSSSHIDITIINDEELSLEDNYYYQNIAFPSENVQFSIIEAEASLFSASGDEICKETGISEERIQIVETKVMRELIMHRVRIEVASNTGRGNSILNNATFRIEAEDGINSYDGVSAAFLPIYKKMADNFETSYLRNLSELPSRMLIVSHPDLSNLQYFTDWKNECGIATDVVMMSDLGTTTADLKGYIQEMYDTANNPPDYLLLIGDVDEPFVIPSYYHSAENDVSDHPYTLLAGDDYLPEMIVGRMSIGQQGDFDTIITKILSYEKEPYMENPEWFDNILLAAGNFSDLPPVPTTPVTTMMWLKEKAVEYGYDEYTEVYYWPPEYINYPGTADIASAINNGVGIAAYRGWGNAWGWNYPYFHTENIETLSNGYYLPVMTSIVCNTGDFANANVDPCFGEKWLIAGNSTSLKGGVAFVGPSDLHTKTKYNNAIFGGFYQGLLDEGIHSFGSAVLRGKWELYENFPNEHQTGADVEFYYYVYNILGDPSLKIWTKTPQAMTCELPSEIDLGTNFLDIHVPEIATGMVTVHKDDEILVSEYIKNHNATLYFTAETAGTATVTITAVNHHPLIQDVEIVSSAIDPAITEITPLSTMQAGDEVAVDITVTNIGTESAQFVANISELTGYAEIQETSLDFGTLAAQESATSQFNIDINGECPEGTELSIMLDFVDLGKNIKFPLSVSNLLIEATAVTVNDANGVLEPGETSEIVVTLANMGTVNATGLMAEIVPATDALTAPILSSNVGDIASGSTGEAVFELSAAPDSYDGRQAGVYLTLEDSDGRIYETSFLITIGVVDYTDVTGPCIGGYYAYDSFDTAYEEVPEYFWQEIDPEQGGSGDVILLMDDEAESIPLPFEFTFFDAVYDSATVSSNGWIAFETTWQNYFRNWKIPGALGPNSIIAAFWDDLLGPEDGTQPLRLCHYYDTETNTFIVEWSDTYNREDYVSLEKFQIVLYDPAYYPTESGNGEIQINYHTVSNLDVGDNYCTVGIQNSHHTDGIEYSFANHYPLSAATLQNEMAIKYTTDPPDSYTAEDNDLLIPGDIVLHKNYPNPFNPETTFSFSLQQGTEVELSVYNLRGKKVRTIVNDKLSAGDHSYIWKGKDDNGNSVASGVYFYQLKDNRHTTTKKCVLMK